MQASAEPQNPTPPVGYDVTRVEAWIARHIPELTPPLKWMRLEGGHSNLTYLIEGCMASTRATSKARRAAWAWTCRR